MMAQRYDISNAETVDTLRAKYEAEVVQLGELVVALRASGLGVEKIAQAVHAKRRLLGTTFKELTPEPLRSRIVARTTATYGDPIGPTIEFLRKRGRTWEQIIAGACRPGSRPE